MKNPEISVEYTNIYGSHKQRNVWKKRCRKIVDSDGILWFNEKPTKER